MFSRDIFYRWFLFIYSKMYWMLNNMKSYQIIDAIFTETMEAKHKEATKKKNCKIISILLLSSLFDFSDVPSFPFVFDSTTAIKRFQ